MFYKSYREKTYLAGSGIGTLAARRDVPAIHAHDKSLKVKLDAVIKAFK
ncbi:hypothetical protein [Janthinobacterium sp. LM6]|nr:hypothetical protein [Janthinobacterium sp. LM6]